VEPGGVVLVKICKNVESCESRMEMFIPPEPPVVVGCPLLEDRIAA
jgi:hypothetical protein